MYRIFLGQDGIYYCEGKLQDSTERWQHTRLEDAVKSMKKFAKFMNGTKIKKKDIEFFRETIVQKSEWVPYHPVFA